MSAYDKWLAAKSVVVHDPRFKPTLRTSLTVLGLQIAFLKAMLDLPAGQPPPINETHDLRRH